MRKKCRIFLSYRGDSEGKEFSKRLYNYLTENPLYKKMYGDIYYSPITAKLGDNFKNDINVILNNVDYFVMPLTRGYFSDFWDEKKNIPNDNSITYHEITAALEVNARFICIVFPGFESNEEIMKKLFNDDWDKITCSILRNYDADRETELLREIGDAMVRPDYYNNGMADLIKGISTNIFLSFKRDTENVDLFPFYQKLYDVKRITILNYAGSSFITGIDVASIYQESDFLKRWFSYHLANGKIEADVILTNPHSYSAVDAAKYKMYPMGLNMDVNEIILHNLNNLFRFIKKYPGAKLNVYLTNIALPYGVMITEHHNKENNHIKVDLYAPVTSDDGNRPSFYLLEKESETGRIYEFFKENVRNVKNHYAQKFDGSIDVSWLLKKNIIHRAVLSNGYLPHTYRSYIACLKANVPIEVDLLRMSDGTIIVGRDDQDISIYGYNKQLSELNRTDLRRINRKAKDNSILILDELLDLVDGRIPILFEIKTKEKSMNLEMELYVKEIVTSLQEYWTRCSTFNFGKKSKIRYYFAIHSANPYVLQIVKKYDCLIPCGQISSDFSDLRKDVGDSFYQMHKTGEFVNIIVPDFLSYNIKYLSNNVAQDICKQYKLPLLGWTIRSKEDQLVAEDYYCDNIIVEGAKSYI